MPLGYGQSAYASPGRPMVVRRQPTMAQVERLEQELREALSRASVAEAKAAAMMEARAAIPGPEVLALRFHEIYERLAPSFGYETRPETRAFDPTSKNGRLMIAVCREILAGL